MGFDEEPGWINCPKYHLANNIGVGMISLMMTPALVSIWWGMCGNGQISVVRSLIMVTPPLGLIRELKEDEDLG